jgi:iron complex transport system substrate-binding protein
MRIASLLASATEIVYALGLGDALVAISHECDYPPDAMRHPRVSRPRFDPTDLSSAEIDTAVRETMARHGSVYELDAERLRELGPDLLLTQAVCEVCAVPTSLAEEASRMMSREPQVVSIDSHSIDQILNSITAVGEAAGAVDRAADVVAALRRRLDAVRARVEDAPRPRVLALEWLAPPFVPGHWTPEMVTLAGGDLLASKKGVPSIQLDWEQLDGLDPDVLLVMPCGYGLEAALQDAGRHEEQLMRVAPRAVAAGRAFVVDGSAYFNRSGPRMVDGVEILGALLHPDLFQEYHPGGRSASWLPGKST